EPGDRAVRLEMRVLDPMRGVSALVDDVSRLESSLDVADSAVNLEQDILRGAADARVRALVVDNWRALAHRLFGIEDRGHDFVVDLELAASFFRGTFGFRDHCGDALAGETHYIIEQIGAV